MKKIKPDQQAGLKKLDQWADLLLDTGKRNNLINFKDTRISTVEVLLPSSEVFFEKVNGVARFEVFDPKIVEEDEELGEATVKYTQSELGEDGQSETERTLFLNQHAPKVKQNSQVLLYNIQGHPLAAIKNISKKSERVHGRDWCKRRLCSIWVCMLEREREFRLYLPCASSAGTDSVGTQIGD